MIKVKRVDGDEYRCICPLHKDYKESLSINVKKNAAICFAGCYEGSAVGLVAKVGDWPIPIAWQKMMSNSVFDFELDDRPTTIEATSIRPNSLEWVSGSLHPYLLNRGFSRSTISYWDIKYCADINHIRIPVKNRSGETMCFSYRTLDSDVEPRYLHPDFKKKSGALFSEHNFEVDRGWVNVVEGPLDCIWMWQCGFPNTLAFLGTPSKQQMTNLLSWGNKFNLCLDNDGPGQEVTKRLEEFISSHNKIVKTIALPVEAKDVQEVDKITLSSIIRRNTHN